MKFLSFVLLVTSSLSAFAQNATTTTSQLESLGTKLKNMGLGINLENETYSVMNSDAEIAGFTSYFLVQPSINLGSNHNISIGAQYDIREFEDSLKEDKNRDHLTESNLRYSFKAMSSKDNGYLDLLLQARLYTNDDPFFKKTYSNDGNYQLRTYFGLPIAGKLYISKYTSYFRYKKYDVNDNINKYTREYELRTRVTPTYNVSDQLQIASSLTYNHIFMTEKTDDENIGMSPSIRYMPSRTYAFTFRGDYTLQNTKETGTLKAVKNIGDTVSYALTLDAYY